ncbi:MAG: hypothetical protein JNL79_00090 [Myxococcales bacterium]|nr:hypothetical protein [Myxococcales bacterium]
MASRRFLRALLVSSIALVAACSGSPEDLRTAEEEVVVCAKGSTVEGIDVSSWQGTIDWTKVKASGKTFAIARISDGTYLDKQFEANWAGIKKVGLVRGAYQFFRPGEDPTALANIVVSKVGKLGDNDLPVTCDVEATDGQTAATILKKLTTWMAVVEAGTGKKPVIYTGKYFWNDNVGSTAWGKSWLWIAAYGPKCPDLPNGWSDWRFFQYSSTGAVSGISGNVDLDVFNGTLADLQALTRSTAAYGAKVTGQSHPATMKAGSTATAWLEVQNVGSATWNASTRLGTTVARDRVSAFADASWAKPDRPGAVTGTVAPGALEKISFTLHAPTKPGTYVEHFGLVQEGTAWFGDQGGPKDDAVAWTIEVTADGDAGPTDAGSTDGGTTPNPNGDAGPASDAGELSVSIASAGGCSTAGTSTRGGAGGIAGLLLGLQLLARRRARS